MTEHVIAGPIVYGELGILQNTVLVVRNGKIQRILKKDSKTPKPTIRFPEAYHLVPGFIDLHVHGANHFDVMDGTEDALTGISEALVKEGTTSYLATTMTASIESLERALEVVKSYRETQTESNGSTILGVHLEGPFISKEKNGAQNSEFLLSPELKYIEKWQSLSASAIRLVTVAPELANSLELIQYLNQNNIVASIGHTNATFKETMIAIAEGCTYATHLFNAMRGIHQREPGVVTACLLSDQVTVEVIADGVHLHPAILQLILKLKHKDKMILVTDAMRAKCLGDGVYDLGGQMVTVKGNVAELPDGRLAGSVLKMSNAIQNMMRATRISLLDVVKMAAENPAKILKVFSDKGSIALHKDADLVVLDDQYNVVWTMCRGQVVYKK